MNFHNPEELYEVSQGRFIETEQSGTPVIGRGEIRGGLVEMSNVDFTANSSYYQQAKIQLELANKLMATQKDFLKQAMQMLT